MRRNVAPPRVPPPSVAANLDRSILFGQPVKNSPLTPHHQAAGARLTGDLLLTYGDVPSEYAAARKQVALFDATTRGALRVRGADAQAFLHHLTANVIKPLAVGHGNGNLLLSGKGKVEHMFDLAREAGDTFLLSTPPGRDGALLAGLDMYHFTEDIELLPAGEEHAPLELCGPGTAALVEAVLGVRPARDEHAFIDVDGVRVTHLPVAGAAGVRLDPGPRGALELWSRLVEAGARPTGLVVHDSLRAEHGVAAWGRDIDDSVYPQEARLDRDFSLEKGCYVGQEVVAKIDTYGGLNKCLFLLEVDHDDPVEPGTRLMREDPDSGANSEKWRDLGATATWAYSFALDSGVVLAYVKRKHQDAGTVFRLGNGPGTGRIVPFPTEDG
jgi:tRNA-modifying protein YgfZ